MAAELNNRYFPDADWQHLVKNIAAAHSHSDPETRIKEIFADVGIVPESIRDDVEGE